MCKALHRKDTDMNNDFENNNQNSSYDNGYSDIDAKKRVNNEPVEASFTEEQGEPQAENAEQAQENSREDTVYHYKREEMPVFADDYTTAEPLASTENQNTGEFAGGTSYSSGNTSGYVWNGVYEKKKQKRAKKTHKSSGLRVFTSAMLCIFVLSFATLTAMVVKIALDKDSVLPDQNVDDKSSQTATYVPSTNPSSYAAITNIPTDASALTIPQIAAKCSPSAVGILVEVNTSYNFGFFSQSGTATSVGSGFVFSNDGYIITNHHVVEGAKSIKVVLHDKTELDAEVVGSDSISDIAVIKVTPIEGVTLTPMEIGNSDDLVVGEQVVAIGCPAGIEYMGTVTDGIVSAINRDVEITDSYGRIQKTMTLIQTNATINKGNSGGPLINSRGQVIGINTLKLTSEFEGIGFSIPMNGAMAIINQLIEHGEVVERTEEDFAYGSGQIGISGQAITEEEAEHYGIPQGVLVYQIDKTSSAAAAGLRRGDIITKYNGKDVKTVQDINDLKSKNRAGETVTITVYRDGEDGKGTTLDITFKLDAQN